MVDLDTRGLRQVGEVPTYINKRRLIRSTKNPLDKCTIISIFPKEIDEVKYTIEPGKFHIDAGSYEKPSVLVVGSSSWWKDIDVEQPLLEIPHGSIQVAESIIKDYCNGMFGCDMDGQMPGLFFVTGEIKPVDVKLKYKESLEIAKVKQDNWFKVLVKLADSLWARSNGNPLAIWDMMRVAAKELNEDQKPWMQEFEAAKLVNCKFCGALRNDLYPICSSCKAIDMSHPLAKEIKIAV